MRSEPRYKNAKAFDDFAVLPLFLLEISCNCLPYLTIIIPAVSHCGPPTEFLTGIVVRASRLTIILDAFSVTEIANVPTLEIATHGQDAR
jgi:hypothetical protein